jgi:hypothetical protein
MPDGLPDCKSVELAQEWNDTLRLDLNCSHNYGE